MLNPCKLKVLAVLLTALPLGLQAQTTLTWDSDANGANGATDGGGTWNTTNVNWYNGSTTDVVWPNTTAYTAAFGAGTVGTYAVTVGTVNAGAITFNQSGYTLSGGTINVPNTGFTLTTNGGTDTVTSALVGASSPQITKTGSGTLVLGAYTATAGTPQLTISGGTFNSTTGVFDSVAQFNAGNSLGGAPAAATTEFILSAGTLRFTQSTGGNLLAATRAVQVNTAGGALVDASGSAAAQINAPITFNAGTTNTNLYLANLAGGTTTFTNTNIISGTGNVVWNGAGTSVVQAANTYTGNTSLNGGIVQVNVAETAGTSGPLGKSGTINFNGGTLQYSAANTFDYSSRFSQAANQAYNIDTNGQNASYGLTALTSVGGTFTKLGAGTLILTGANTYSGTTTVSGGTLQISNNGTSATLGGGNVVDNAALSLGRANAYTVGNIISGTGSVAQIGAGGTLTLTGSNLYTGTTTVTNGGTLLANNTVINGTSSATGTGTVTVGNAAGTSLGTLGGTGSVLGATTINTGSTITGGTNGTVGALTLGGALTLTGANYAVDINGATADQLTISGVLTLSNATLSFAGTPTAASYILATFGSETGAFSGTAPSGYVYQFNAAGTELDLVAVPEPATWVGAVFLTGLAVLARRWRGAASLRLARR